MHVQHVSFGDLGSILLILPDEVLVDKQCALMKTRQPTHWGRPTLALQWALENAKDYNKHVCSWTQTPCSSRMGRRTYVRTRIERSRDD